VPPVPFRDAADRFAVGLNVRDCPALDAHSVEQLRPSLIRFEMSAVDPSSGTALLEFYASLGVRPQPLVGFQAIPSDAQIDALAEWARSHAGAFDLIEFGNESYIHLPDQGSAYALAAKRLAEGLRGSGVGVLIQADDNNTRSSSWIDAMYAAVPDLHRYAAGWVIHPYGPQHSDRVERVWTMVAKHGGGEVPFYATEFGLAVDGGRMLSNNYGYPRNLTFGQAGPLLTQAIADLRATGKVAQVMLYQSTDQKPAGTSEDREAYFGVLAAAGQPKGAYTGAAVAALRDGRLR
jgi:hypothetical protein